MIEQIIKLLNSDNTVSANRLLAHALGIKAALLFNSLVGKQAYYEKHSMLDSEGWFYSTIEDMQESTALSRCLSEFLSRQVLLITAQEVCTAAVIFVFVMIRSSLKSTS